MKKTDEKGKNIANIGSISENDEIFDPDDNLYNNPESEENLTFTGKIGQKSNNSAFLKKRKKDSNYEK